MFVLEFACWTRVWPATVTAAYPLASTQHAYPLILRIRDIALEQIEHLRFDLCSKLLDRPATIGTFRCGRHIVPGDFTPVPRRDVVLLGHERSAGGRINYTLKPK